MKIIPVYLPQFHTIPENDKWWGKGFTEWVNVRNAKPLFEGHNQPRIPLNNNYYDLSELETLKWQCNLAREHGIYGFCMYHYWFNGHLLLEKPMEMLLAHPEIDINYCISWANHDWTDAWKANGGAPRTLIAHNFDDEQDWVDHFNYMLPFFEDSRYMKEKGKPILVIYVPNLISKINKMLDLWTKMAQENGFNGLTYIYQSAASTYDNHWDKSKFDYGVEMNPQYINLLTERKDVKEIPFWMIQTIRSIKTFLHIKKSLASFMYKHKSVRRLDYDECWQSIINHKPIRDNLIPCAFTDWDNTPRHKMNGYAYDNVSPKKFKYYLEKLILKAKREYPTDMIFVFAWNEWAEGGYLEPDQKWGLEFLNAVKECLENVK